MIATVTNTSATETLNELDSYTTGDGPSGLTAVGGARVRPLPFPFSHLTIAPSGTAVLPMNARDMRHRDVMVGSPHDAGELWGQFVQQGLGTITFAAQADSVDAEDDLIGTI